MTSPTVGVCLIVAGLALLAVVLCVLADWWFQR